MDGSVNLAISLWHVLIGGAGGIGAILLAYQRVTALMDRYKGDVAQEAIRRSNVETRLTRVEGDVVELRQTDTELFRKMEEVREEIIRMRHEQTVQHAEVREYIRDRIDEVLARIGGTS